MKSSQKSVICPKCHHIVPLKFFICPNCRRVQKVVPTEKSIFFFQCECGKVLPTTNENDRHLLTAVCPECYNIIGPKAGIHKEIIIPIIGGPSTGKSAFLGAWIVIAQQLFPRKYEMNISFPFPEDKKYVKNCNFLWSRGLKPEKTTVALPNGIGMDVVRQGKSHGLRIYCYDPAGEFFDNTKILKNFVFYDYMDGAIFLIDPFTIKAVRNKFCSQIFQMSSVGFQVSDRDVNDYCDRFINSLKRYHNLKDNQYHYAFCAVVITKTDAFDLDSYIGEKAVSVVMSKNPKLSFNEALNLVCVNFLETGGLGDVLEKLRTHFKEVRCFSVSAFGHMPDLNDDYNPKRVEHPFLWLLSKTGNIKWSGTQNSL
ncbi:MAG: hypothetical protein Q4C95_11940 [Planctomycetia bacterium]|nr:hypothetical protein [Planctomycetia bacterium]